MKASLTVTCRKESLSEIRSFIRSKLLDLEVAAKVSDQIVLATDEACANCIIHQHQCDASHSIEIGIYKQKEKIYIEIKDEGEAFPIHQYQPTKLEEIVKRRKKGGLGIMLIKKLMDEVKIEKRRGFYIYRMGKNL